MRGDKLSPVLHLGLAKPNTNQDDDEVLDEVAKYCIEQGVAVVTAKYLTDEMTTPPSRYKSEQSNLYQIIYELLSVSG